MFDELSAHIMKFCLDLRLQGKNLEYYNGSIIKCDKYIICRKMGNMLLYELSKLGNTFTSAYLVEGVEEKVYESIGLRHNVGHLHYIKDERPYV